MAQIPVDTRSSQAVQDAGCSIEIGYNPNAESATVRGRHLASGTRYKRVYVRDELIRVGFDPFERVDQMCAQMEKSLMSPSASSLGHIPSGKITSAADVNVTIAYRSEKIKKDEEPHGAWRVDDTFMCIKIQHRRSLMKLKYRLELPLDDGFKQEEKKLPESQSSTTDISPAVVQMQAAMRAQEREKNVDATIAQLQKASQMARGSMEERLKMLEERLAGEQKREKEVMEQNRATETLMRQDFDSQLSAMARQIAQQGEQVRDAAAAVTEAGVGSGTADVSGLLAAFGGPQEDLQMGVWRSSGVIVRKSLAFRQWNHAVIDRKCSEWMRFEKEGSRMVVLEKGIYHVHGYVTIKEKEYGWVSVYKNGNRLVSDAWVSSQNEWCSANIDVTVQMRVNDFLEIRETDWATHSNDRLANQLTIRRLPGSG